MKKTMQMLAGIAIFYSCISCQKLISELHATGGIHPHTIVAADSLRTLLHNACNVYSHMRNAKGIYQKTFFLDGTANTQPSSVAVIGMGVTSECIAHAMGWEPDAKSRVLTTLQSLTGGTTGFTPVTNAAGLFPHYINMETGANTGANGGAGSSSEFSTIDNAVLMSGLLFCKKYFNDSLVSVYVDTLWAHMQWPNVVADSALGKVYLALNANGTGSGNTAKPYNEYILVCWLAMNRETDPNGPAHHLWNKFYTNPDNLPKSTYAGIDVIVARPGDFIAEHVYQMPYFFCHGFSGNNSFLYWMDQARKTDSAWWKASGLTQSYEYGISAGSGISQGYTVNAVNDNSEYIVSPHTLAGYFPVHEQGKNDLLKMWVNHKGVYPLPFDTSQPVIWRYSPATPAWQANVIQGVDFATFMLGLAALPEALGFNFFNTHNNFF